MNFILKVFLSLNIAIGICLSFHVNGSIPFEKCNLTNRDYTARIVESAQHTLSMSVTSAGTPTCENCLFSASQTKSLQQVFVNLNSPKIPSICFFASTLRGSRWESNKPDKTAIKKDDFSNNAYYYCRPSHFKQGPQHLMPFNEYCTNKSFDPDKCQLSEDKKWGKRNLVTRRPCLNRDYIDMTAKAFNEVTNCFGFSDEKDYVFALLNHESTFLLNKKAMKSKKNVVARCYGQIIDDTIIEINRKIKNNDPIYQEVIEQCPYLKNATTAHFENQNYRTCKTSQNPYSCLFYTLYNLKINEQAFIKQIDKTPEHSELPQPITPKIQQIAEDFNLPINNNEIVIVKNKKNRTSVFKDSGEVLDYMSRIDYDKDNYEITKIELFDPTALKKSFLYYAHNAGISMIYDHFTPFMKSINERISSRIKLKNGRSAVCGNDYKKCKIQKKGKKACYDYKKCLEYREIISKKQSLPIAELHELFSDYSTNIKISNQDEVAVFIQAIDSHLKYFDHEESGHLSNHLKELHTAPNSKMLQPINPARSKLSQSAIDQFLKQVKEQCPTSLAPILKD